MAVEKAILFDELEKSEDDEERVELRRGGRGGRGRGGRGGRGRGGRGGRGRGRGGRGRGRGGRGSRGRSRGSRSARGASARGARSRSRSTSKQGQSPGGPGRGRTTRTASKPSARRTRRVKSAARKTTQAQTRRPSGIGVSPTKKSKAKVAAAPSAAKKTTSGVPRGARFKSTAQTRKDIKNVEKKTREINRDFDKRTAFKTKSGDFVRDSKGNIVRSKTQVDRFKEDKRRQDIARKLGIDTTLGAAAANPNLRSRQMTPGDFRLSGRLADFKKSLGTGQQTPENLRRLVDINRQLGDFDYAGMGIGNQLRTQGADLAKGLPGLAKIGGALAGGPAGLASLALTGGKGVFGLLKDRFSKGQETQTALAEEPEEGGLKSLLGKLKIGEPTSFRRPFDRREPGGGGGGGRPQLPIFMQGPQTGKRDPALTVQEVAQQTPITAQPLNNRMLNSYLALAGFTPEQISGFDEETRYIG